MTRARTRLAPAIRACHSQFAGVRGAATLAQAYSRAVAAAFFDLDKTVIAKASLLAYGSTLRREGYISRRIALRAMLGQLVFRVLGADDDRMTKVREASLRMARGWDQARLRALVNDTLHDVIAPIVYDEAIDLMAGHRDSGHRVYLVSSAPAEIVDPLAAHLRTDGAISTRAQVDQDGKYTGEVEFYAYGPTKAQAVRELAAEQHLDLAISFAYSDSATDIPLLETVGNPIAVNPDRELRRVAVQRDWQILTFNHPVPLRDRVSLPGSSRIWRIAGALSAMAVGVIVAHIVVVHTRRRR